MKKLKLMLAAAAAAGLLAAPAGEAGGVPLLKGSVGPGFTISLKNAAGKRVTTLRRGLYRIRVVDRSAIHDFHLKGPGVNRVITGIRFTGTRTVRVRLRAGRYTYVCDPHDDSMRGSFRVR